MNVRATQGERILALFQRNGGTATNAELNTISFRYGARLFELKKKGHIFSKASVPGSPRLYTYTYHGKATA